jgi:hypothetical protein
VSSAALRRGIGTATEPLRAVRAPVRPRNPATLNGGYGLRDGELVVVPPGQVATGLCGDCGMDDGVVGWCRLCTYCADLRELQARRPPPNPGRAVRS